jgi:uridine kinase
MIEDNYSKKVVSTDRFIEICDRRSRLSSSFPFFINLGGASASGKTTIAMEVAERLGGSVFIMDNYLINHTSASQINHISNDPNNPFLSGVNPAAYDIPQMLADLSTLKEGLPINYPVFDKLARSGTGSSPFNPQRVVVVEGIYANNPEFLQFADVSAFADTSFHDRFIRKILRNHLLYQRDISEIMYDYLTKTEPTFRFYEDRLKKSSDYIVPNPLNLDFLSIYPGRELLESKGDSQESLMRSLNPPYSSTTDESFVLVEGPNQQFKLRYRFRDKLLIDATIQPLTVDALRGYYSW